MTLKKIHIILSYAYNLVFLHLLPNKRIIKSIEKLSSTNELSFTPTFSGRTAIQQIALTINSTTKTALIPDYICNIVYLALENEGFKVILYKLNHLYEADINELNKHFLNSRIDFFLSASIYGSSGMLDKINDYSFNKLLKINNTIWILDLCQDISLIKHLPKQLPENVFAISSFNNKSFPGVMGGGIWSKIGLKPDYKKLSIYKKLSLYKYFILTTFRKNLIRLANKEFEFSKGVLFPYEIINYKILKLQLILGVAGLKNLNRFYDIKQLRILLFQNIVKTKHYSTAAYLACSKPLRIKYVQKSAYAVFNNPKLSLRSDSFILHNKGFQDA